MVKRKITREQVIEGRRSNLTQAKIAEQLGVAPETLSGRERALGYPARRRGRQESDKAKNAKELLLLGEYPKDVARMAQISYSHVKYLAHLLKAGGYRINWRQPKRKKEIS